jgi:two-component system NarL family sensor kinase
VSAALPDPVNTVFFRIAQEALTNIVQHSKATRAALTLELAPGGVTLTIADNGEGFDVDAALADLRGGVGLRNMRERLDALGGTLEIESQIGRTVIAATVPLPLAAPTMQGFSDDL